MRFNIFCTRANFFLIETDVRFFMQTVELPMVFGFTRPVCVYIPLEVLLDQFVGKF